MNPWLETAGVALIALSGMVVGVLLRRFHRPWWVLGYAFSLLFVAILLLGRTTTLHFRAPFTWLVATRMRFILIALAATLGLTTPLSRLPRQWEKVVVALLMTGLLLRFSVLPFLLPALLQEKLAQLTTTIDDSGVCRQTTRFTCGPAAAVTALRHLGLSASEGQLAILSHASPAVGTLPACLSQALHDQYADEGLRCRYRRFDSIAQLGASGIALVVVKNAFLQDHCVAVLDVSDTIVTVADPITGITAMPHDQFRAAWRFSGIVLSRDPVPQSPPGSERST